MVNYSIKGDFENTALQSFKLSALNSVKTCLHCKYKTKPPEKLQFNFIYLYHHYCPLLINVNTAYSINIICCEIRLFVFSVDCKIRSFWQTIQTNPNKFTTGNVLLTGATGYVGCFILQELLLHTQVSIQIEYMILH